jgi:hypothetical protein
LSLARKFYKGAEAARYNRALMPTEIIMIGMLRSIIEVAGLVLLVRGLMWLFGSRVGSGNFVYDMFTIAATPLTRVTRYIMPRSVVDRYIPVIAFLLVLAIWVGLAGAQQALCIRRAVQCA